MTTGNRIRKMRKIRGLTVREVAAFCGCSPSAISQYENGSRQASPATLAKIATALQCSLWDITSDNDMKQIGEEAAIITEAVPSIIKHDTVSAASIVDALQAVFRRVAPQMSCDTSTAIESLLDLEINETPAAVDPNLPAAVLRFSDSYSKLSDEGRRRVFEYMEDLAQIERYQRDNV